MRQVRIIGRPVGSAPDWVRDAWIGLSLPTLLPKPRVWRSLTVEQASAGRFRQLGQILRGRTQRLSGFAVPARAAVDILAQSRPDAAEWWRSNHTQFLARRSYMLFDTDACEPLGGNIMISPRYKRLFPASPGRIGVLWAAATVVNIADRVCFGGEEHRLVLDGLYQSGTPVLVALLVAGVMRMRGSALHLVCALVSLDLVLHLLGFVLKFAVPSNWGNTVDNDLFGMQIFVTAVLISIGICRMQSMRRRVAAYLIGMLVTIGSGSLAGLEYEFWTLSEHVRAVIGRADPDATDSLPPQIEADRLWDAQPALVAQQIAALHRRVTGASNLYSIAIAGSGAQALFGREAQLALKAVKAHFGQGSRGGVLLSNAEADQLHAPLATRGNIAAVAKGISGMMDASHDIVFIYLASHGSRSAELASDLANMQSVQTITSSTTAQALNSASIHRRIIVISACFAASWIPALANDDTIVIAAAAKDRTSFGCDDSREVTVFGEVFLSSLASPTISLHDAFEAAKRKISVQERAANETPSQPQAYVGRNMQMLWTAGSL